jgi:hypothetical protein
LWFGISEIVMMHHYKLVGVQFGEGAHCKKCMEEMIEKRETKTKPYNSGYLLVVTHLTTNPPVRCLNRAERTGSLIVSYSAITKTIKLPMCGIALTEHSPLFRGLMLGLRQLVALAV